MNSGAEAVETAVKTVRKLGYIQKRVPEDRAEIIVCANNFHGRTITIVGFSTDEAARSGFGPFTPGFKVVPFGNAEAFERAITPNTVAFLVEPIQGEAGVIIPPAGYLRQVRDIYTARGLGSGAAPKGAAEGLTAGLDRSSTVLLSPRSGALQKNIKNRLISRNFH